jgi:hypothetical protein
MNFKDFRSLDSTKDSINGDMQVHVCSYLNENETYPSLKY